MTNTPERTTRRIMVADGEPSSGMVCGRVLVKEGKEGFEVGPAFAARAAHRITEQEHDRLPLGVGGASKEELRRR